MTTIFGVVNLTRDSFSDGGLYLEAEPAVAHGAELLDAGADWLDLGAQSTHPDSEDVSVAEELERLEPVVHALVEAGAAVSVDTFEPEVMRRVLELGATCINDVTGLANPAAVELLAASDARIVLMHSRSAEARADRSRHPADGVTLEIADWFRARIEQLEGAGIDPARLWLDPGMGFFLGAEAAPSLAVLRGLQSLAAIGPPVLVGTSRKSFLGEVTGRSTDQRGPATLASELWAATHGAEALRSHDVRALADALRVWRAIENFEPGR